MKKSRHLLMLTILGISMEAVGMLYGPQPAGTSPLVNADGKKLLTEKSDNINDQAIERPHK